MPRNSLLVQYFVTQETPVPLPAFPISATRSWPNTPRTPSTPMTPMFIKAEPLQPVREVPDEKAYEMHVLAMGKELGHDPEEGEDEDDGDGEQRRRRSWRRSWRRKSGEPHALTTEGSVGGRASVNASPIGSPNSMAKLPPLGDEVLLEFGRPPLANALRLWSDGFGKRACVYGLSSPPPPSYGAWEC